MRTIYKFHFDCGRQGILTGLFIEDSERLQKLVDSGEEVYFGEVLGKHSEIYGPITSDDYTEVTNNPDVLKIFDEYSLTTMDSPVVTYLDNRDGSEEGNILME